MYVTTACVHARIPSAYMKALVALCVGVRNVKMISACLFLSRSNMAPLVACERLPYSLYRVKAEIVSIGLSSR